METDWSGRGDIVHITTDRKCSMCLLTTKQDQLIQPCQCAGWVHSHCVLNELEQVGGTCPYCRRPITQGLYTMTNGADEGFDRGDVVYVRVVDHDDNKKLLKMTRTREGSTFMIGICQRASGPGTRMPLYILERQNTN